MEKEGYDRYIDGTCRTTSPGRQSNALTRVETSIGLDVPAILWNMMVRRVGSCIGNIIALRPDG